MPEARLKPLDLLRGVSRYFSGRETADGSIVCPRHRIEHTGKVVYSAVIDLKLRAATGEKSYGERVRRRVLRTLTMLQADPKTGTAVFFPGSLDNRNASSNLIDSGACCDVLAQVLEEAPELFSAAELKKIGLAIGDVCDSYLMTAVMVKEVPAQRLWGATGLARAARALDRPRYGEKAREAVRLAISQAHPDGSIPYMPDPQRHGEHVGLADITTFYHSRHVGFICYIYQCLEEVLEDEVAAFLRKALGFLNALYGRDGIKPLVNEAKQWYWESAYEVASHTFDVHAFAEGARLFDDPRHAYMARLSYERLAEHVDPRDGGVVSHRGKGINFQCRDFWNGHVAWIARVYERLAGAAAEPPPGGVEVFEDAGIVRVERRDYVAILRGKKQPVNISFGGEAGGGSLVYFGRREGGFADLVRIPKWTSLAPGNFVATPVSRPPFRQRVAAFYRDNRHDMRFRLYIANVERKAGNTRHSLGYSLRHVVAKARDEMKWRYASHFDTSPSVSRRDNEMLYSSMLARRDGTVLKGAALARRFLFGELDLEVEETLTLELEVRAVLYERIEAAQDFQVETDCPHKTNGRTTIFQPAKYPQVIRVSYRL